MPKSHGHVLGILVSSADDKFEGALLRGVADAVSEAGGIWICFTSGAIRSHHGFEFQRNILYNLVNREIVSGLVVSGTLGHVVSHDELMEFCRGYEPLPLATVAVSLEGIPRVLNNSYQGIRDALDHLISVHGIRNIAFLRGPANHQEAEERLCAFLDGMKAIGYSNEEALKWVGDGEYTFESGQAAMRQLLERSLPMQAVVSSNDSMALGALQVLRENGLRVPEDIALTGFDDTEEGRQNSPPLTTVFQPVYYMGKRAGEVLLAQLNGKPFEELTTVKPNFIIRQSCGCVEQDQIRAGMLDEQTAAPSDDSVELRERVARSMAETIRVSSEEDCLHWMGELHDSFLHDLDSHPGGKFLQTWKNVIQKGQRAHFNIPWQDTVSAMRRIILPVLKDAERIRQAEALWHQARVLIGEEALKVETDMRLQAEQRNRGLREISEIFMTCHTLTELLDVIALEFPRLKIHACYLALFDKADRSTETARLVFAYDRSGRLQLPPNGIEFQTRMLLPDAFRKSLDRVGLVAEALYSKETRLGFMLLEVDAENAMVCSALRGVLSNALQGVILEEQRNEAEAQLRQYQSGLEQLVADRTSELRDANRSLATEIEERLKTEAEREALIQELERKNAELERFAYTVSHDLKSPLITIRGFLGHLEKDAVGGNIVRLQQDVKRISDAADKMYALLNDLLDLSRIGRVMNPPEKIRFVELVNSAVELVSGRLQEKNVSVRVTSADEIIYGDRQRLTEVLQNLIDNAAKFTSDQRQPQIEIGVSGESMGKPVFFVRDNGIGISPEHHERIFGLFNKLDPNVEGTGVGLTLVKRIIELHGGRIWVESEEGKGATFFFTLPKAAP